MTTTNKARSFKTPLLLFALFLFSISFASAGYSTSVFTETFGTTSFNSSLIWGSGADVLWNYHIDFQNYTKEGNYINWNGWDNPIYVLKRNTDLNLTSYDSLTYINTPKGLLIKQFGSSSSCGGGCTYSWISNLSNELENKKFLSTDTVSLYCSNFNKTSGTRSFLIFGNDDYSWGISLTNSSLELGSCADGYLGGLNYCCDELNILKNYPCENNEKTKFEFTFQEVFDNCEGFSSNYTYDVEYVGFLHSSSLNARGETFLDDLTVSFSNGTNELPTFNLSEQDFKFCINTTNTVVNQPLNVSVQDPEGDTIYYSLVEQDDVLGRFAYIDEDFTNYDVFGKDYFSTNETVIDNSVDGELYFLGVGDYPAITLGQVGSSNILTIEKGSQDFSFISEESLTNSTTGLFNLMLSNNTVLDVIYKDALDDNLFTITFNHSVSGTLQISLNGVLNYSAAQPYFNSNYENYLVVQVAQGLNTTLFTVKNDDLTSTFVSHTFSTPTNNIKKVVFDDKNSFTSYDGKRHIWGIDNFNLKGWNYIPTPVTWSTDVPTLSLSDYGVYRYILYVSDSYHQPTEYKTESVYIGVYKEKYCAQQFEGYVESEDSLKETFKQTLGYEFRNYLTANGVYDKGKIYQWWIFWGTFIFVLASTYIAVRRIELVFPLIVSTTINMVIAILLGYTGNLIAFSVLFSLAVAMAIYINWRGYNGQ